MTDVCVPRGASVKLRHVDGDLEIGSNARLEATDGTLIIVTGGARFGGDATVQADLECENLVVNRSGELKVAGNLTVHGALDVPNSIVVEGTTKADDADVGGRIRAGSIVCRRLRVGGTARVSELLKADAVEVGGKIEAPGTLDLKDLCVGGKAHVGGGKAMGTINVGGRFESTGKLDFGELQIYGVGSLAAGSKGKKMTVSGKVEADGDIECDQIEIAGAAHFLGGCKALRVEVRGKLSVVGSLSASERLDISGVAKVGRTFSGGGLNISGSFSAERAVVAADAEIHGRIETREGLRANSILVRQGSRCIGPIVGQTVCVGGSGPSLNAYVWGQRLRVQAGTSQVGDVYASSVVIGPGSRAGRIFAESVELESGCDVTEVMYVNELKMADHVRILNPVNKVEKLKESPL